MNVEFVRFKATDDVELQGWLSLGSSDTAVVHIHGMSGNGYENYFLDNLRDVCTQNDMTFFTIDTRGRGVISEFKQGDKTKLAGSCFEIFEESVRDIQGAIDYLKARGKKKFVLEGHSLGCTKVVNFVLNEDVADVTKIILLAPTDMAGWAKLDPNHATYLTKAKQLLADGKPEELVGAQCWSDNTPLSAQTYPTICEEGSSADIYGQREGGALLGQVEPPMLIPYGAEDIGIKEIDGTMDNYLKRVNPIKHVNTQVAVIEGAPHSFRDHEQELANVVWAFIREGGA